MAKLLRSPFGGRMGRDAKVQYPAPVMGEDEKYEEQAECRRWNNKEICRDQILHVVLQECLQSL